MKKYEKGRIMKLNKILGLVITAFTANSFAVTTPAFDAFLNNVTSDVQKISAAQSAQVEHYKSLNTQLVYTAKKNGNAKDLSKFMNAYQNQAYPSLIAANQAIANLKSGASVAEVNAALNKAKSDINAYQTARMSLFNNPAVNAGGYYVVNREANFYLCTYENSQIEKTAKSKLVKLVVNTSKVAACEVAHEKNLDLDLDKKAALYATSITAPTSVANIALANATYFSSNDFINRVNAFATQQKADTKSTINTASAKVVDAINSNINLDTCHAAVDSFRDSYSNAAASKDSLKMLLTISQPKSMQRTYIDVLGLNKNNTISDALDISYVSLTGKAVKDASKDYDICSYKTFTSNKTNNIYLNKLVNFDDVAKKTNGLLTPEQVYQLFVMSAAKGTSYTVADKNSGALRLFN